MTERYGVWIRIRTALTHHCVNRCHDPRLRIALAQSLALPSCAITCAAFTLSQPLPPASFPLLDPHAQMSSSDSSSDASGVPHGGPYWWQDPELGVPDWRELFSGGTERDVLYRLIEGDPLDLRPLCWVLVANESWMIEPDRLFMRSAARIAMKASLYKGEPELDDWMDDLVTTGLGEILEEDREAERAGLGVAPEDLPGYRALIPAETGIEDDLTRRATVIFNQFEEPDRRPFYEVVVVGYSVEEYVEEHGLSMDEVVESIANTTQALVNGCDRPKGRPKKNKRRRW